MSDDVVDKLSQEDANEIKYLRAELGSIDARIEKLEAKTSPLDDKCRHNHTMCEDQRSIAIEDIYTDADTGREYATLHFYRDDPKSMAQLQRCLNAEKVLWAVLEFDQWLRSIAKHKDLADVAADALMNARKELHQCFTDRGLSVWEE